MITTITRPETVRDWIARYCSVVRVIVDWDRLAGLRTPVTQRWLLTPSDYQDVYYPHYVDGGWMQGGTRRPVEPPGTPSSVVQQAPAVFCVRSGVTVLVDGCHRVRQLNPRVLILDVLELRTRAAETCFADLLAEGK